MLFKQVPRTTIALAKLATLPSPIATADNKNTNQTNHQQYILAITELVIAVPNDCKNADKN